MEDRGCLTFARGAQVHSVECHLPTPALVLRPGQKPLKVERPGRHHLKRPAIFYEQIKQHEQHEERGTNATNSTNR